VVVMTVVIATDKPENAHARADGLEVLVQAVVDVMLLLPMELLELRDALFAHTRMPNVVVMTVVIATDKPENAHARTDGLEVLVQDVTANAVLVDMPLVVELLLEDTVDPPLSMVVAQAPVPVLVDTNARFAHTNTQNVVVPNVVIATVKLEHVHARTDGPEVHALHVAEDHQTTLMEAVSSNAQCALTREQNAVVTNVVLATDKVVNANAKHHGTEVLAATEEESSELVMLVVLMTLELTLSQPLPLSPAFGLL